MRITAAGPYPYQGSLFDRMNQLRIAEHLGVESLIPQETGRTAVLVIDEQWIALVDGEYWSLQAAPPEVSLRQQAVLRLAAQWQWPIAFVQYWTAYPLRPNENPQVGWAHPGVANRPVSFSGEFPSECHADLRLVQAVGGAQFETFTKLTRTPFGFDVLRLVQGDAEWASLSAWLDERGVRRLIVIGQQVNHCVRSTVVNLNGEDGPISQGATNLTYTVLSCPQVVWGNAGEAATWADEAAVEFYDAL